MTMQRAPESEQLLLRRMLSERGIMVGYSQAEVFLASDGARHLVIKDICPMSARRDEDLAKEFLERVDQQARM